MAISGAISGVPSCVAFTSDDPPFDGAVETAERIEATVFGRSFGESAEALHSYYDQHVGQTVFVLARPPLRPGVLAGDWTAMMRVGLPGPLPSLSAEDAAGPPFDVDVAADLAAANEAPVVMMDVLTTAVLPRSRNQRIFDRMIDALVRLAEAHGCTHVIAMVDGRVIDFFRSRGTEFTVHSGLHPYYGSSATAATSIPVPMLRAWVDGLSAA